MTSFSDFPIRRAMSLTRIFAAAIQSPSGSMECGGHAAALTAPAWPAHSTSFCSRRLFLGRRLLFVSVLFLFFVLALARFLDLFHLLVLLGELDHLPGRLFVDVGDRGEVLDGRVHDRVVVVVAGLLELVGPFG